MEQRKEETLSKLKEEKAKLQAAAKDAQAKSDELRQKETITSDIKGSMSKVRTQLGSHCRSLVIAFKEACNSCAHVVIA